ncbi:MAG: hypothetical protein QXM22_00315 [Candidatus Bathyarchaeia archaeon]
MQKEQETNENNTVNPKKIVGTIMLLGLVVGLLAGIVLGYQLYQVVSIKLGFWEGKVEATHIVVLTLRHQIQSSDKIRTTIILGNTGQDTVLCNFTAYYKGSLNEHLAVYSFNATIDADETYRRDFTVTPINVSQWAGTDLSIFEY